MGRSAPRSLTLLQAVSYVHSVYTAPAEASVVWLSFVTALGQSREPRLSRQMVKLGHQGIQLQFDAPKPRSDVGRYLLTEIPGADCSAGQQPCEQTEEYDHPHHRLSGCSATVASMHPALSSKQGSELLYS